MGFFNRHKNKSAVLVVCRANVCRSPMAEGIFKAEAKRLDIHDRFTFDSAGTHASQRGRPVDPRAVKVCRLNQVDVSRSRARQVRASDFNRYEFILAMDQSNVDWLSANCPADLRHKVSLIGSWLETGGASDIPDPYYGNLQGFEIVFEQLQASIQAFMTQITEL